MAVTYLKQAARTAVPANARTRHATARRRAGIEAGGEAVADSEPVAARGLRLEGTDGRARTGHVRLVGHRPGERFDPILQAPAG